MSYLITAVLLICIIALIILFRASKKEQPEEAPESAETSDEQSPGETIAGGASEVAEAETAPDETETAAAAVKPAYEEAEAGGAEAEHAEAPVVEEEFIELSFAAEEAVGEERRSGKEEFVEISLDMGEEESTGGVKEFGRGAEEELEDTEVAPALTDSLEESEAAVEEAPEELTEKLNYYFGGNEEIPPLAGEPAAVAEKEEIAEEIVLDEPLPETMEAGKPAEEEEETDAADRLTMSGFAARLRDLESKLRQELKEAIENRDTGQRALLEFKLLAVCEKQASLEDEFDRQQAVIETAKNILDEIQIETQRSDLPGIDIKEANRRLVLGDYEQVEKILSEGSLQLDHESELASRVYYLCGQLAEERLDYEGAFEDYRNTLAAENDNEDFLLAAGRIARILEYNEDGRTWLEKLVRHGLENKDQSLVQSAAQYELAMICVREGQKEKAGALFQRALEIREKILGKEHPDLGRIMHDYAALYESNGMYEQAERLYTSALEVMERKLGNSHPKLASTLNRLAGLYEEMEQGEKSLPLYERALAIKEKILGRDHHDVGTILNSLADLLRRRGKLEQAEPMFMRSLEIAENELGRDHPNLTVVLNNLAELYSQMGRDEEAARYQERAFSLFELLGMDGDFVEMEKDEVPIDDDRNTTIAGK